MINASQRLQLYSRDDRLTDDIEYIRILSEILVDGGEQLDSEALPLPRLKNEKLTDARAELEWVSVVTINRRVTNDVVDGFPVHHHFLVTDGGRLMDTGITWKDD